MKFLLKHTAYTLDTVETAYTVYDIETAFHCLNFSMYAYIYCMERLKRYWNGLMQVVAKSRIDTPQTVMTTRQQHRSQEE